MMNDTNLLVIFSNKMITLSTLRNDMNAHATMIVTSFSNGILVFLSRIGMFWCNILETVHKEIKNEIKK